MFLRENGRACGNASDQGQKQLGCLLQGVGKVLPTGGVDGPDGVIAQADTTGGSTEQFNDAFSGQCLQMLFSSVCGFESKLCRNFCPCGWGTGSRYCVLDQVQNLLLPGREFGVVEHGGVGKGGVVDYCFLIQ